MQSTQQITQLIDDIDRVLPQTQCGECSYGGCRPYAEAIVLENEGINRCPPGGVTTLHALALLTQQDHSPYVSEIENNTRAPARVIITESECIGCTKCIQACPVDAIIGSAKSMHTILAMECTGCGLCLPPCPVDCIDLKTLTTFDFDKDTSRKRFHARIARREIEAQQKADKHAQAVSLTAKSPEEFASEKERQAKRDYIQEAIARAQAKKNQHKQNSIPDTPNNATHDDHQSE